MNASFTRSFIVLLCCAGFFSCASTAVTTSKRSPREKYESKTANTVGKNNPVLSKWRNAGEYSLHHPLAAPNNYFESGRFFATDSSATSFAVNIKRGQKLTASFRKSLGTPNKVYLDLWNATNRLDPNFLIASDTINNMVEYIAGNDMDLILRFQGEIGFAGNYFFTVQTGPSLLYPIAANVKAPIGSFWGDGRDGGTRKHEGVDIMAPKHSVAVAAASGVVTDVSENSLGGKVVSIHPDRSNLSVYYAHLDSQFVQEGQRVQAGDPIGLTGNTGNARNTVSHLHFGIYVGYNVAIDPLLFIKPVPAKKVIDHPFPTNASFSILGPVKIYPEPNRAAIPGDLTKNTVVTVKAVTDEFYRVALADGRSGFILRSAVRLK